MKLIFRFIGWYTFEFHFILDLIFNEVKCKTINQIINSKKWGNELFSDINQSYII